MRGTLVLLSKRGYLFGFQHEKCAENKAIPPSTAQQNGGGGAGMGQLPGVLHNKETYNKRARSMMMFSCLYIHSIIVGPPVKRWCATSIESKVTALLGKAALCNSTL